MNQTTRDERTEGDLEKILRGYAEARLSPGPAASSRMRALVMREAHRRAEIPADSARLAERRVAGGRRRRWRVATALLAAALGVGLLAGAALAARPGGALYGVRLAVEELFLPEEALARVAAEIERLEARLAEVRGAIEVGDDGAAAAALDAYQSTLEDAVTSAANASRSDELEDAVSHHISVLEGLVSKVPEPARDAIQHAIERSGRAVERLDDVPPAGPGQNNGNGNGNGNGRPDTPPGHGGEPPGQGDDGPGRPDRTPPGKGGDRPGDVPPGHGGEPPGQVP